MRDQKARKKRKYAANDYSIADLPPNRWRLFLLVIREEWKTLVVMGFVFLLMALPLILSHYHYLLVVNRITSGSDPSVQGVLTATLIYYAVNFGILLIVSVFFGGVQRIFKRMSLGQGFLLGGDFLEGIRENWKENLPRFGIHGLLEFGLGYLSYLILLNLSQPILFYVLRAVLFGILRPAFFVGLFLGAIYSDPFFRKFSASIIVFLKYLPLAMGAYALICWPSFFFLIGNGFVQLFLPMILSFLFTPIGYFGGALLMNRAFDSAINKNAFPELYRAGLSPSSQVNKR